MGHRDLLVTHNLSDGEHHCCRPHSRGSVRRASGFVLTSNREVKGPIVTFLFADHLGVSLEAAAARTHFSRMEFCRSHCLRGSRNEGTGREVEWPGVSPELLSAGQLIASARSRATGHLRPSSSYSSRSGSSLVMRSQSGWNWNHPAVWVPTNCLVASACAGSILTGLAAASASSCAWQLRSMVMNHHAASSTVCPTVRSPWLRRMIALYAPSAFAMRSPSEVSYTTPVKSAKRA